jgi:hypothetical protein
MGVPRVYGELFRWWRVMLEFDSLAWQLHHPHPNSAHADNRGNGVSVGNKTNIYGRLGVLKLIQSDSSERRAYKGVTCQLCKMVRRVERGATQGFNERERRW